MTTASEKPTTSKLRTASRDKIPQAVHMTATCPASPEYVRSYYDVRSSGQYLNISVPSCVATTRIQSTNYPTTPINWLRQSSVDDHSNVSYIKKKQSPLYDTLATKNWTVVTTTTYSNPQSIPVGPRDVVVHGKQEKLLFTHLIHNQILVYTSFQREKETNIK